MFVITNQLSVKPEFAEAIEKAFLENIEGIQALPGFQGFRFLRPLTPETTPFLIETTWADQAAFEHWKQSDHFKQSHSGMGQFREAFYAPPKMGQYSLSHSI